MTKSKSVFRSVMCLGETASQDLFSELLVVDNEIQKGEEHGSVFWGAKLSFQNSELEKDTDTDLAQGHGALC